MFLTGNPNRGQPPKIRSYHAGRILPVLRAKDLMASAAHQQWLVEVQKLAQLEQTAFDHLFVDMIQRFAEFVQLIPYNTHESLSSLLNYSLARARLGLQQLLKDHPKDTTPLERYAVFSAGLLTGVNRALINHRVTMVNVDGDYEDDWHPFEGSLVGKTDYYKLYPLGSAFQRLERPLTILLARQLLSKGGFEWLAEDCYLFADWIDALMNDDSGGRGRLQLALANIKDSDLFALLDQLMVLQFEMKASPATEYGEQFLEWLKARLDSGEIQVNAADAPVHVIEDGVVLEKHLFKQFADIVRLPVNMTVVFAQFGNLMGIVKKGGGDYLNAKFFSDYPNSGGKASLPLASRKKSMRGGMLVKDAAVIFNKKMPAKTTMLRVAGNRGHQQVPGQKQQPGPESSSR